ncbi:MAG: type IV pilin N-terminal domain-containing protein [Methanosarcinales archaeon]|nr:type IV pilin N-terminal domain-containing protein [Methanosarcinales archaeon]MCD4815726.1 type IV pilin N-terminal domain-containing protein [Methanosarcinales archaeon]
MRHIKNEEAVSPVLGVILMVAITVIVATIIAVFMFGVGEPDEAPQAKLKFTANATDVLIKHEGGDALLLRECLITITNADDGASISGPNYAFDTEGTLTAGGKWAHNYTVTPQTAGTIIEIMVMDEPTGQLIANVQVVVK